MYERNAIVIDRYFGNMFGYDQINNIKNNSNNYFELVNRLEGYQKASEIENNVMIEFEKIAGQIKETQRLQETLNKRNAKYSEIRKSLFENLEEEADVLNNKFQKTEEDIRKNNEEIKSNIEKFVEEIREFHAKTEIRTECGRERRIIENSYQKQLNITTDNFERINKEKLKEIKSIVKSEDKEQIKNEIKEKIFKNGAKERVPFDKNVINKAIDVSTDIEEKKVGILLSVYDKTGKLLDEIKNDNVKIEKHKKIVRDAKSKLEFLNVITEYIVLFLDNERMNIIGGEIEHEKSMIESCENVQKDLNQIQNMYSLLLKEITDKSTKKAYKELYKLQYLFDLQDEEKEFEKSISGLSVAGTIIYPDYWRIEGMQKIYDTFKSIITNVYDRDITEFEPIQLASAIDEDIFKVEDDEEAVEIDAKENEEIVNNDNDSVEAEDMLSEEKVFNEGDEKELQEENDEENQEEKEDDEKFEWDDEDENEELNFGNSNYNDEEDEDDDEIFENEEDDDYVIEEAEEIKEDDDDENKRDKEIDKILGFFDDEDDDEDFELNFDDEDELEDQLDDEEEEEKEIKTKTSRINRRKKQDDELDLDKIDDEEVTEKKIKKRKEKDINFRKKKKNKILGNGDGSEFQIGKGSRKILYLFQFGIQNRPHFQEFYFLNLKNLRSIENSKV